jgi:protein O-mannosyl-transferase
MQLRHNNVGTTTRTSPSLATLSGLGAAAILVVTACVVYLPALRGAFILDDDKLVTENSLIRANDGFYRLWTKEAIDYWPITNTSFWMEWRLWGTDPMGYHVTNLVLHVVCALLIWRILLELSIPGAFLAALLYAVHPVNVESVAWISQRKNMLAMAFFLLSIYCYVIADVEGSPPQHRVGRIGTMRWCWYWLSLLTFTLAMLSKGSVAILPLVLLAIVWWQHYRLTRWDLLRSLPFFVVAALLTAVNIWFQKHGIDVVIREANFAERLAGAGAAIWFYVSKALLPINLVFVYPQWLIETNRWQWWLPLVAAAIATAILWLRRDNAWCRPLLLAWVLFCVALLPALGFADVGFMKYSLVADHYQHISILMVMTLVAATCGDWYGKQVRGARRLMAGVAAVVAVGLMALLTFRQGLLYSDPVRLYEDTLAKNPDCWMAHNNLAAAFIDLNEFDKAIVHCQQALQQNPDYPDAENNLGMALFRTGRASEAIEHFQRAIRIKPDYFRAFNNLGAAQGDLGNPDEAIEYLHQALSLKSNFGEAHYNLGRALASLNRGEDAKREFQEAIDNDPDFAEAHNYLGVIFANAGSWQDAIREYEKALSLQRKFPEAFVNLGSALSHIGRRQQAVGCFQQALQIRPDYVEAHYDLGVLFADMGRTEAAIEQYQAALRANPKYLQAWSNLAVAQAQLQHSGEAIDSAQRAIDVAQALGQTDRAKQIATWLNAYRSPQDGTSAGSGSPNINPAGK